MKHENVRNTSVLYIGKTWTDLRKIADKKREAIFLAGILLWDEAREKCFV